MIPLRSFVVLALAAISTARAQVAESIEAGIVRFHASEAAAKSMPPSFALVKPFPALGNAPENFPVKVQFSSEGGKTVVTVPVTPGTSLYGTGCVTGPFLRNGQKVTTWNTDAYGYAYPAASLYQSHP